MIEKRILNNTFYQIASRLITSGSGLIITIIIARHFGILGYGQFTTIIAFVGLFYLFADFGFNAIFLQKEENVNNFRNLFYLRLLITLFLVLIAAFLGFIFSFGKEDGGVLIRNGILIFSATIIGYGLLTTANGFFQKHLRFDLLLKATIGGSLITLILVLLFIKFSFSLEWIMLAFVFGSFLTALIALFEIKQRLFPILIDKIFIKSIIKESLPLGLMLIFNLVYFRIDMIILSVFRSSYEVGIYGFSYRLFDFLIALPLFLSNSIYPSLIASQKNYRNFFFLVKKYALVFFVFSFLTFLIAFIFSPLIPFIKEEFKESILPFRLLALSLPVFFLTSLLQWTLISQKRQKTLLYIYSGAVIINIVLNLIFIPLYGYMAAVTITIASELIVLVALLFVVFRLKRRLMPFMISNS